MSGKVDYLTGQEGEFTYRGYTTEQLQSLSLEEVAILLPSRTRRTLQRGLTEAQEKLREKVRKSDPKNTASNPIRTHIRDIPVLPEFIGFTFAVYDGHKFQRIKIEEDMLGYYLGEFHVTRNRVRHGTAGVGATRSSKFVPLK
jgi:small subunit ribosomal protein S19